MVLQLLNTLYSTIGAKLAQPIQLQATVRSKLVAEKDCGIHTFREKYTCLVLDL